MIVFPSPVVTSCVRCLLLVGRLNSNAAPLCAWGMDATKGRRGYSPRLDGGEEDARTGLEGEGWGVGGEERRGEGRPPRSARMLLSDPRPSCFCCYRPSFLHSGSGCLWIP